MADLRIERIELSAPRGSLEALETFYGDNLGVRIDSHDESHLQLRTGHSTVRFSPATGDEKPFYHFAFLIPGNRFTEAHSWLASRTEVLRHHESGDTVFDFAFMNAHACYFHDPAGNIVELIAHRGIAESYPTGHPFSAEEIVGVSEIGLVTPEKPEDAKALNDSLGLTAWRGDPHTPDELAFVGRQAHTLILTGPGRGWLPTGRPAEPHPVRVALSGTRSGNVDLGEASHNVMSSPGSLRN